MKHKALFLISALFVFLACATFVLPKPGTTLYGEYKSPDLFFNRFSDWRLGLDLVGGSSLVYNVDLSNVNPGDYDAVTNGLKDVIEKRVNLYGVSEPRVRIIEKGNQRQILVELAGISDVDKAVKEIGATPTLTFEEECQMFTFEINGSEQQGFGCSKPTELTGRYVKSATWGYANQGFSSPQVNIEFNEEGAKLFEEITERNVGKQVAISIDGNIISAPVVNEKIAGGRAQISGEGITIESAKQLAERFNAGALGAPISLESRRTVNATAAEDSLLTILVAGCIGIILVIVFMLIMYGVSGIASALSLIFYIVFTLAVFKITPGFAMSLAGITGFILSIGSAVDASILIFERAKEEEKKGASRLASIENRFRYAWISIRDSNISTMIIALTLYFFSSSFVKGFALTLLVGMAINLVLTYIVTRNILRTFYKKKSKVVKVASK